MLRELLETGHELVHTHYRISHENRGTIGQTVYVFSDFILLDSDLCVRGDVVVAHMCDGFVIDIVDGDLCRSVEHFADIDCESTDRTFRS